MPKPIAIENGSGMHVNLSLSLGDENAFYDPDGEIEISEVAKQFIAGVLKHVKAITCIANPLVNSYKRLIPGYEAPVYITLVRCESQFPHTDTFCQRKGYKSGA